MFSCTACPEGQVTFSTGESFIAHYQFNHSNLIASGIMVCKHSDCVGRKFAKMNSFRKHVLSHVSAASNSMLSENIFVIDRECDNETSHVIVSEASCSETEQNEPFHETMKDSNYFDDALSKAVITFISSLYQSGSFTESQIQMIIDSHKDLLGGSFLSILKTQVISLLSKATDAKIIASEEVHNVQRMFDSCLNLFDGFETPHLRTSQVLKTGAYIAPVPFTIGPAQNEVVENGFVIIQPIVLTGQFIPFQHVLKGFLELPNVLAETLSYVQHLEQSLLKTGQLRNIIQGTLWREKIKPKFPGKCVLPLIFTFDDYETNKELGYHCGVHKLGAGFVTIACIPPKYASALENIFLAVLILSGDRAAGNAKVFRKVIQELKFLEENGITVVTPEMTLQVYFALVEVAGDNLGVNGLLGLVEGFTANHFCRICSEHKSVCAVQSEPNPAKIRTPGTYESDILINNPSLTGRKEKCVFNEVDCFDVCENFYLDTMHDLDEGVLKYVMFQVVKYLFDKNRFNIDYLNDLVQSFHYGPAEEKNRMPYISKDDLCLHKRLKCSASEMKCFTRYFGLMVGHLVLPADMKVWNVYLKLRKIVDILSTPIVKREDVNLLKNLVKEHHTEYQKVFNLKMKPKFHFLVHEADLLMLNGPPQALSCYRTEHKNKEGKDVAKKSNNRINLPYTVAHRHQLKLAFRLLSQRGFVPKFEYTSLSQIKVSDLPGFSEFSKILPPHCLEFWNVTKTLHVNGAKYTVGSVVLHSLENDNPVFGQIVAISPNVTEAFMLLQQLHVVSFDDHFHAFHVANTPCNKWLYVNVNDLLNHVSTEIRQVPNGKSYVAFRFSVTCFHTSSI